MYMKLDGIVMLVSSGYIFKDRELDIIFQTQIIEIILHQLFYQDILLLIINNKLCQGCTHIWNMKLHTHIKFCVSYI